jgi:hypothetical protein
VFTPLQHPFGGECKIALEEAEICTNIDDPRLSTP